MTTFVGQRLGFFEITALLGRGGMGEVYRAQDTRLKREVAIKVLPEDFAGDPSRIARFQREAEALAALNHPHIAVIHDVQESHGSRFLVMELVDGETLAERIRRGPIPVDETLQIAKQIAEALAAAHEQGIIHRDLKPANIKFSKDGQVKVLDFGLAKAFQADAGQPQLSNSPTLSNMGATNNGVILGTASYMSPEQARGRTVDRRTDIFAFGCVLFEMLTGKQAFEGDDVAEILSRILQREPDWTLLPTNVNRRIRELLRMCLQKDLKGRRSDAGDIRLEIDQALLASPEEVSISEIRSARNVWLAWIVAAASVAVAIAAIGLRLRPAAADPEMRLEVTTPYTPWPLQFALSPDGQSLVFVAPLDGHLRLWLRRLDRVTAEVLNGTEDGNNPFWSPNSQSIGFFAPGKLKRLDVGGGAPRILADVSGVGAGVYSGSWNVDGTILFTPAGSGMPLSRISASGGEAKAALKLDPKAVVQRVPQFLPDGRHFIYHVTGEAGIRGIYFGSLDGSDSKMLTATETAGAYLPPDRIAFIQQGALIARRFDVKRGKLVGEAEPLADSVASDSGYNRGGFSISASGRIAYLAGGNDLRQLTWFDRAGHPVGTVGEPDTNDTVAPMLSPDGLRLAIDRTIQNKRNLFVIDLLRGITNPVTHEGSFYPVWSPNGSQIALEHAQLRGGLGMFIRSANGTGEEELLLQRSGYQWPLDWSKVGSYILYYDTTQASNHGDLFAFRTSDKVSIPVANSPFSEKVGSFSPTGQWVAFETDESGRLEIMVQSFPNKDGCRLQVSTNGGSQPRWSADGKELYFIAPDLKLMAAAVRSSTCPFDVGAPVPLFQTNMATGTGPLLSKQQYDVSADGRFIINQSIKESTTPITIILNWKPK